MKKKINYIYLINLIFIFFILYGKDIFINEDKCINAEYLYEFTDYDFRKKNGLVEFDTIGCYHFQNLVVKSYSTESDIYPYVKIIRYFCKSNREEEHIGLSDDSSIRVDYYLDSLNAVYFHLIHEENYNDLSNELTSLEAYELLNKTNLFNNRSFYGYNKDSLNQLILTDRNQEE